uniref:Nuclear pore complex protein Nup50 n=1 Tax=Leptobrachium leishanense TaxID=445787 RepID=A0A8C5PQB0_9ANUR
MVQGVMRGPHCHADFPDMAKRIADKELTDRNWDHEEEAEDAGTFSVASKDILKSREIKKAKRRNPGADSENGGAFKGFKGLVPSSGAVFPAFGNGSGLKATSLLTNGSGTSLFGNFKPSAATQPTLGSLFSNGPSSAPATGASSTKPNGESPSAPTSASPQKKSSSSDYNKQLSSLNCSVRDWIVKHVNANPLCDLSPIFRDYEKHLSTIEQTYGSSTDSGSESDGIFKDIKSQTTLTFGAPKIVTEKAVSPAKESEPDKRDKKSQLAPSFSFGQKVDTSAFSFSFSNVAPGAFGKDMKSVSPASPAPLKPQESTGASEDAGGEEVEEPPKAVIQEVKEDDAFYSKKCKLFYKKGNEFKEKGVGTLHLKPVGGDKTQLLIRADTNLGNILLNILVQSSMPCTRTGKNNVMIVCAPNPPIDEKNPTDRVTMLIRVKSADDANELHKILLEKKV